MKRALIVVAVLLLALPAAIILGAGPLLDSAATRTRIADAVQRATGHPLRIDGPIRLAWSLAPTVEVQDAALLNPPGFSRPEFATIHRMQASVALLPLLTGVVVIHDITLDQADILLERDASGRANWLVPPVPPSAAPAPAAPARVSSPSQVRMVTVLDGRLAFAGFPALIVKRLTAVPTGGPIAGTLLINDTPISLRGEIARAGLSSLDATGAGVTLTAKYVLPGSDPLTASGQDLGPGTGSLTLTAPDLGSLGPAVGRPVPPLRDVTLSAALGPAGPSAIKVKVGASDLSTLVPNLQLGSAIVEAAGLDQPLRALDRKSVV